MPTKKSKSRGTRLSLESDAYGGAARASAFADYLEARALLSKPILIANLEEAIRDHSWAERNYGLIITEENQDEEPSTWTDSLQSIILQRSSILGARYPFKVVNGELRKARSAVSSDYARLLRITIAQSYGYNEKPLPETVFERLVLEAMKSHGLQSGGVGTGARKSKTFVRALGEAATSAGLIASPNPLPRRRHAKDGGVDVLSGLSWGDPRPGNLAWLTQVTVGDSSTWMGKIKSLSSENWMGYLRELHPPGRILAVPHHVEDDQLSEILRERQGTVVDRLRLVGHLPTEVVGESGIRSWFDLLTPEL